MTRLVRFALAGLEAVAVLALNAALLCLLVPACFLRPATLTPRRTVPSGRPGAFRLAFRPALRPAARRAA
jgi:hypothetical protein